jgi:hydroxyacylglutathione hydrolase
MKIERFEVPGLAQYAYILSSGGKAVVIDPIRDIEPYLEYARANDLTITHILETHIHADFASGATALAHATASELWLSAHDTGELYAYQFPHHPFSDRELLTVDSLVIQALHTPGHTPEHLSFLVFDTTRSATIPAAHFSGDFLFVGGFGRPDLLGEEAKQQLAAQLYHSAHHAIAGLPDGLEVFPGHGAGSLCGSGMGDQQHTTLGYERAVNPFFTLTEDRFINEILASVPPFPPYYRRMKQLNSDGASLLTALPGDTPLSPAELAALIASEPTTLLDLRRPEAFGGAHIPGSINIGAGQNLSLWAGWLLEPAKPIVLIGDPAELDSARRSLIRVGLDNIRGYLSGDIAAWIDAGKELAHIPQCSAREAHAELGASPHPNTTLTSAALLDVRSDTEWSGGHIAGAIHIMLGDLPSRIVEVPTTKLFVLCGSGYRSSIATSILAAHGFHNLVNIDGGMAAWRRQQLPLVRD